MTDKARLETSAPDMAGPYNDPEGGGYDFCRRGIDFRFNLVPGAPFAAKARLGADVEPEFVLGVFRNDQDTTSHIFKERLPTEPASKFVSHSDCAGNYPFGTLVDVMVHVTTNAKGGVEVQLYRV